MAFPRPLRQSDYYSFPSDRPIVIDNGASNCRIGWAGEDDPRFVFRNIVQRPRHKQTGETVTMVGDIDPKLMKYFDFTRSSHRSAFDSDVVYQFETIEYIFDYCFERIGVDGPEVDHPILITECVCNPVHSRSRMAELLFETYGVPSLAYGVDAAFSYKRNQKFGICDKNGIAICAGFNTSHVIPFMHGEPVYEASCRTNVGGYHITDHMKQLLSLQYPQHMASLTWDKVEDLKKEHCYVTLDYATEARQFQKGTKEAADKTICWQLPWVPPPPEEGPSEEEVARKAAIKEKQGQRLREMAAAKRSSRIVELENHILGLEFLMSQLRKVEEQDIPTFLRETGYSSRQEIEADLAKTTQSLRRTKREPTENENAEPPNIEKFPLLDVPDEMLSPEQLEEKKRQVFLKSTSEGRQRAKQKRQEAELLKEKENKEAEERRLENPDLYLEDLRGRHRELSDRVEQKKRLKTNGSNNNNNNNNGNNGGVGRGERLNAAHRERMRLLTTAAFDRGKGEDTFGAKDEDWQLYKLMSKDNDDDDDGPDPDEVELARVASRLQEIDPVYISNNGSANAHTSFEVRQVRRPLRAEDFQITFGIERFRCPEILFQPPIVGVDQAGLDEMVGISIRKLPDKELAVDMCKSIFLTGGSCMFPGIKERLHAGITTLRPYGSIIKIVKAMDPVMDAWRGASAYASSPRFGEQVFTKQEYYEKGEDWLRRYQFRYCDL